MKVLKVNTAEPQGQGPAHPALQPHRQAADTKRAIVTLAAGERIELFES